MPNEQPRQLTRQEARALRANLSLLSVRIAELRTQVPYFCVEMEACADTIDTMLLSYGITGEADKKIDAIFQKASALLDRANTILRTDIHATPAIVDAEVVEVR
jgi:hypothetical protein